MAEQEDGPREIVSHQIGQKLDDLSIADFDDRIALLKAEVARLEQAKSAKRSALAAAGSVFRTA